MKNIIIILFSIIFLSACQNSEEAANRKRIEESQIQQIVKAKQDSIRKEVEAEHYQYYLIGCTEVEAHQLMSMTEGQKKEDSLRYYVNLMSEKQKKGTFELQPTYTDLDWMESFIDRKVKDIK